MPQSRRFARVRRDHSDELAEDYTELIAELERDGETVRVADLARALGVSHVTVLRALQRLEARRLVRRLEDRGVTLTASGRRLADRSRERHRVIVTFLRTLGVPEDVAEGDAEGLEHHLSDVTVERLRDFLAASE